MKNHRKSAARVLLVVEQLERRDVRSVVYWTGDAGTTHWNDAGNWSTVDPLISNVRSAILPGPSDNVIIDLAGVTVDHSAASRDVIGNLRVTGAHVTLNLSAGTLDLSGAGGSGTFQVDQTGDIVHLFSVLKDATVTSGTTIVALGRGGALDGVTLDGTLLIDGATVTIKNGLVLNGVIDVFSTADPEDNHSTLTFDDSTGPQTLSTTGLGHIDFGAGTGHLPTPSGAGGFDTLNVVGGTLTIAAGVTIHSTSSIFATDVITGPIDNLGSIVDDSGGIIAINFGQGSGSPVAWTNHGTIEVSSGTLELGGAWTNDGTITASSNTSLYLGDRGVAGASGPNPIGDAWVNNGTISTTGTLVYLGGYLTQEPTNFDPDVLGLGTDMVYLVGTLNNSFQTLTLTPGVTSATGAWTVVSGGQVDGGTVDATAAALVASGGTLDGVTLDGTLDVFDVSATIRGGLVLNGMIQLGDAHSLNPVPPVLLFDDTDGPQTLSTTSHGSVHFKSNGSLEVSGGTLTIAAGITIRDDYPTTEPYFATMDSITGSIDNFGNIVEDSGGVIAINFDQGPGSLYTWMDTAGSLVPWTNHGAIEVSKGTLSLGGPWTNDGAITAGSGTTLNLGDSWVAPNAVDPNPTGDAWVNNGTISTGGTDVSLGGNLSWSPTNLDVAALGLGQDTVSIRGTLDNSAHTLTLTPGVTSAGGNWIVFGQFDGGMVDEAAAMLIVNGTGKLNGVTLINQPTPDNLVIAPGEIGSVLEPFDTVQSLGPNGRYVDLLYRRLLGRAADMQGATQFVSALDSGQATRADVAEAILQSQEYLTREVTQLYQTVLGRAPDASGIAHWVAQLAAGASHAELEASLLGSPEYDGNAGGTDAEFVSALYQTVLGRKADTPGIQNFTRELAGGVSRESVAQQILASTDTVSSEVQSIYETVLNRAVDSAGMANGGALLINGGSPQQLIVQLVTSAEFVRAASGDVGQFFVANVYQELLGRSPDQAGLALYAGEIDAGTATRLQIVEVIQGSTEYRTDAVGALYQEVLGRAPDAAGLAGSLAFLQRGGTLSQLETILLSSDEFFALKGGFNSGFLTALYQVALNRNVDSGGAQSFGQALAGGVSRASIVADVLFSSESQTLEVKGLYTHYLGRSADPGGLSAALAALKSGVSLDLLASMFIASSEFLDRL